MGFVCAKPVAATHIYELWNTMLAHNCHILSQMVTHCQRSCWPGMRLGNSCASRQKLQQVMTQQNKICKFLECSTMLYIQQALGYSTSRCILSLLGTVV